MSKSCTTRSESRTAIVLNDWLKRFSLTAYLSLGLVVTFPIAPVHAQLFNSAVDQLPVAERVALKKGEPIVTGENGKYVARILVTAPQKLVWSVITDYNNFSTFLPNITSSRITETTGTRKVLEQVNTGQFLFIKVKSRTRTSITEKDHQRINFQLIDGDLKKLQGYWSLDAIAPYAGAPANQVLITQSIEVQPPANLPQDIFYNVFKETLGKTMASLSREVSRRSQLTTPSVQP